MHYQMMLVEVFVLDEIRLLLSFTFIGGHSTAVKIDVRCTTIIEPYKTSKIISPARIISFFLQSVV